MNEADKIHLTSNLTLTHPSTITRDVELDLGGHEITADNSVSGYLFTVNGAKVVLKGRGKITGYNRLINVGNGGELTVENGVYTSQHDVAFTAIGEGSKIIMNGGKINAVEGGIGAFQKAEIVINNGEIRVSDNFAIFTNGSNGQGGNKITVNGGKLIGNITSAGYEAIGVYIANNDTFIMNGGEIIANNGTGLCMRGGNVRIEGGKIISTGEPGHDGKVGDDTTVLEGISAIVYHHKSPKYQSDGMKLVVNGGEITGVDKSIDVVISDGATPDVTVNGGNLTPGYYPKVEEAAEEPKP